MSERFHVSTSKGPDLAVWETDKFKTLSVRVVLRWPLGPDVAQNALLAELLRRGTRSYPDLVRLEARLQDLYGAQLRADTGRVGDVQTLSFHLEVVSERYLPEAGVEEAALDLLAEVLTDPKLAGEAFPPAWVEQEKQNLAHELDALVNDKAHYAHLKLLEAMYPGDPYAWPRTGRREDIEELTPEGVYRHYRRLLAEAPAAVYAVGSGALAAAHSLAERLANLRGGFFRPLCPPAAGPGRDLRLVEAQPVQQGKLAIGYRGPATAFTDQAPAGALMAGVLGGFSHSKLFRHVREEASLAYYAYSRLDPYKGGLYIHSGIEVAQYERVLDIIRRQVEDVAAGRTSQEEWDNTLSSLVNQIRAGEDHPARMMETHLELALAGRPTGPEERIAALGAVRPGEVESVAQAFSLDAVFFLTTSEVN